MTQSANRSLLRRYPGSALIRVTGADAKKWLQGLVTSDLNSLRDNAFWGLMLQRNGKVRCELVGVTKDSVTWIAVVGGELRDVYSAMDSHILMDDVELAIVSDVSLWAIHDLPSSPEFVLDASLVVAAGSLRWFAEGDRVFIVDAARELAFVEALRARGLEPCNDADFERLRVSSGIPKWSVDYSDHDTPHHAALFGRAVAEKKGCYIGQEVVCKTEMIGRVAQRLTRLELESAAHIQAGTVVYERQTGESAGVVTSAATNSEGPSGWAIARLKTAVIDARADLSVGENQARIVDML